jgi:hypothetical protein
MELTLEQRLRLSFLKGTVSQIRLWSGVLGKVELSTEERAAIALRTVEMPDGRTSMQWRQPDAQTARTFTLENDEARAVAALLAGHPGFSPTDLPWVDALLHSLNE